MNRCREYADSKTVGSSDERGLGLAARTLTPLIVASATVGCIASQDESGRLIHSELRSTATVSASADAFVCSGSYADDNFGTAPSLEIDGNDQGSEKWAFLRFDVGDVGTIARATLRLYVTASSRNATDLFAVSSSWSESSITWNSLPTVDDAVLASLSRARAGDWVEVDLTDAVRSGTSLSIALIPRSNDGVDFMSRDAATNQPELLLETIPETVDLSPSHDAFVRSGTFASEHFGTRASLETDGDDRGSSKWSYLRFDTNGVDEIVRAVLRLYVTAASRNAADVVLVSSTAWDESSITWNSRPPADGPVVATLQAASAGFVEIDVTDAVTPGRPVSLALLPRSGDGVDFAAKEAGSTGPLLLLEVRAGSSGCGDGMCSSSEECASCAPDCGACSADAGVVDLPSSSDASPCLQASQVVVVADVPDGERIDIENPADGVTFDMRGVDVRAAPSTHLIDFEYPYDICVTGGSAIASYPAGFVVNWQNVKDLYDEGGFHTTHPRDGTTTFDRIYIEGVEDGLMIARATGSSGERWVLRHSYLRNVIDDAIENDGYRSGEVIDTLFDGVHMFYSARNSDELPHTVSIADSVIGFACKADPRTDKYSYPDPGACPEGTSTQYMFKLSSLKPEITIRNTVIHQPAVPRSGRSSVCLPADGDYENVTVVWSAPDLAYPCSPPPGVTVTTDISAFEAARADWLERHGCNADGTRCSFLER